MSKITIVSSFKYYKPNYIEFSTSVCICPDFGLVTRQILELDFVYKN